MSARRTAAALLAALGLVLGATACAEPAEPDAGIEFEAPDTLDCEKGERKKKERPDCGRIVNGRYVEWSWVKAGKTRPGAGWSPAREPAAEPTRKAPTRPATTTGPARQDSHQGKPAPAPTKSRKGGRW